MVEICRNCDIIWAESTGSFPVFRIREGETYTVSQEKVNRYKEQKKNRKAIQARKKRNALITKVCASLAALALVAWLGYSVMDSYEKKQNSGPVTADITALDDYTASLNAEE